MGKQSKRLWNMKETILVVEDNPQNMRLIEMILRAESYNMITANDGEKALEVAIREHPELIIMDIQLPKINGYDVTKKLRELPEFDKIPIIALTAYAMKGDQEKCIKAGCNAYLSKPINTRELNVIITNLLRSRINHNQHLGTHTNQVEHPEKQIA
jgi:CheY-like chemotaxis protein